MIVNSTNTFDIPDEINDNLINQEKILFYVKQQKGLELKSKFFIITNFRIIFLELKMLDRYTFRDFFYTKFEEIYLELGINSSQLQIKGEGSQQLNIDWMSKDDSRNVMELLCNEINSNVGLSISINKKKEFFREIWRIKMPKNM